MSPPRVLAPASPLHEEQLDVIDMVASDSKPSLPLHAHIADVELAAPVGDEVVPFAAGEGKAAALAPMARQRLMKHLQDGHRITADISVSALLPPNLQVVLDTSKQHTLSWEHVIRDATSGVDLLPAGSCNLYQYPMVVGTTQASHAVWPEGAALGALEGLVLAFLRIRDTSAVDEATDEVGATVQHALAVANTDKALALLDRLMKAKPSLLTQCHSKHRSGISLFTGETTLHILAANGRESLLCALITLVARALPAADAQRLFTRQAEGIFFHEPPMIWFGSTPLNFACAFELCDAVHAYLATGLVTLNDRAHACRLTGFLPIHTAVAHGHMELYDHLTSGLADVGWRADAHAESRVGRLLSLHVHGLSPLALATHTTFRS